MEFTKEFIESELSLAEKIALPFSACSCGKCGQIWSVPGDSMVAEVTRGDWGDDYPALRQTKDSCSIHQIYEVYMDQITYGTVPDDVADKNMKYFESASNNYPEALKEILRLKSIIEELSK